MAVAQLLKTIPNVTLIGTASKHKHEAIKNYYSHLIERGTDYVSEVKKYVFSYLKFKGKDGICVLMPPEQILRF